MVIKVESGDVCPLMGKTCIGLQCAWFTKVQGVNPNTGDPVEDWACAIAWLPMLAIENSQNTRMTGAAVESFRNNMMRSIEQQRQTAKIEEVDTSPVIEGT
tara:strand:- start:538 stop:840 length:303 start_codon:yes stop_codon:yes gene_type:complete